MIDVKNETIENLTSRFLRAASRLNGNFKGDMLMDGGESAARSLQEVLNEMAARYRQDPAIHENKVFNPLFETLKTLPDVSQSHAVAMAVKDLPIPSYTPLKNPKNPFAPQV